MPVSSTPSKRVALAPVNINMNIASPLQSFKNRPQSGTSMPGSMPLTPSLTPKVGLVKSLSTLAPSSSRGISATGGARKLESFSEYKITNSRNVKADLAATKLKLRLQLAFYKLKLSRDAAMAALPNIRVSKILRLLTLLQQRPQSFSRSANVNLQNPRLQMLGPRLSVVALAKNAPATSATNTTSSTGSTGSTGSTSAPATNLKLYHIKPLSAFYNTYTHRLPLTSTHAQRLPPVHKILRTPIKAASRALLQMGNAHNHGVSNSDETIDETVDESLSGDPLRKKSDILGSSPLRHNSFGTPNSFSVAKSLLQLGLGLY